MRRGRKYTRGVQPLVHTVGHAAERGAGPRVASGLEGWLPVEEGVEFGELEGQPSSPWSKHPPSQRSQSLAHSHAKFPQCAQAAPWVLSDRDQGLSLAGP